MILKSVGHTLTVHVMNVKAMKVPDKPKGLLVSQCMAKKNNATSTNCCLNLASRPKCARVNNRIK